MKTMFVFPGQGSQVLKMGFDLYNQSKSAKNVFQEVDDSLGFKLSDIIFGDDIKKLTETQNLQPALMTVSIAILYALQEESKKKIEELCDFVSGHSLGEYSAICATKSISVHDVSKILKIRGNEMSIASNKQQGGMIAIMGSDFKTINNLCNLARKNVLAIANDNSVGQIVISGDIDSINKAMEIYQDLGIKKAVKLPVSGAFHSSMMESVKEPLKNALSNIVFKNPIVKCFSNITADIISNGNEIAELLVQQITHSVRWRETLLNAQTYGATKMIEIGSGSVLCGLAKRTLSDTEVLSIQNYNDVINFCEKCL